MTLLSVRTKMGPPAGAAALAITLMLASPSFASFADTEGDPAHGAKALEILVNANNPFGAMSASDIEDLFLARRQFWAGRVRVLLVLCPTCEGHRVLVERFLKMSKEALDDHYLQKRNQGILVAGIRIVASREEMVNLVAREATAIGYALPDDARPGVRVVLTITSD